MTYDYSRFVTPLPHPGDVLRDDFMADHQLTAGALAKAMGLRGRQRIERLVRGEQAVTSDTALRLARVFGTTPELWMNMQSLHDLSKAAIAHRDELARIQPLAAAAA